MKLAKKKIWKLSLSIKTIKSKIYKLLRIVKALEVLNLQTVNLRTHF